MEQKKSGMKFKAGDRVFWTDPDEGWGSGWYTIKEIEDDGDMVYIGNDEGSETECYPHELSASGPEEDR